MELIVLFIIIHAFIETGILMTNPKFRNRNFLITSNSISFFTALVFYPALFLLALSIDSIMPLLATFVLTWLVKSIQYTILFGLSWKLLKTVLYASIAASILAPIAVVILCMIFYG